MAATSPALPRPDPLAEFNAPPPKPVDLRHAGRTFGAVALVATGLAVSGWLVYLVHSAVFRPDRLGSLTRLVPPDAAERVLTVPAGRIELPAAGLSVLAYVLLIILAAITTKVAVALIKEGTGLLRHVAGATNDPPAPRAAASTVPAGRG